LNGKIHREDGPAVEYVDGSKEWYLNDKLHREDGPAMEWANGSKSWWLNGKLHREDGPAMEWADGDKSWYLNGKQVTKEEHKRMTSKVVEMASVEMTIKEISKALGKQVKVVE
jgi:hypothetical protein